MTNNPIVTEAMAQALYESVQRENGNPSALPWAIVRDGETAPRWYAHARAAILAMREASPAQPITDQINAILNADALGGRVTQDTVDALVALVRGEASAIDGWRPIDTAPKDGTAIDVWVGGEFPGRRTDVEWREPTDSEWWVHGGDTIETPAATWHDPFGPFGKEEPPMFWQPIPAPPVSLGDAKA